MYNFYKTNFDFFAYIRKALLLESAGIGFTWYVSAILGIYLFTPFVSIVKKYFIKDDSNINDCYLYIYIYCFLPPSINLYLNAIGSNHLINEQVRLSFSVMCYFF